MKNKNKVIGILVGTAGVIASIGAASALYIKEAQKVGFGIGAKYSGGTGAINYLINGESTGTVNPSYVKSNGENGGEGLGGVYTQVHYSFPLSATFSSDIPAQPYVNGNFKVDLKNINSVLVDNSVISIVGSGYQRYVEGQEEVPANETIGYKTYNKGLIVDEPIDAATKTFSYDLCVGAAGGQSIDVWFKLNSAIEGNALADLHEGKLFDLSVTWGEVGEGYEGSYVISAGSSWSEDSAYAMYPNLKAKDWEWMFTGLSGELSKAKCKKGGNYSSNTGEGTDADGNVLLDAAKTYDVYWNGNNGAPASFVAK